MNRDLEWFTADQHQRSALRSHNTVGAVTVTLSDDGKPVQVHQTSGYQGEIRDSVVRMQQPGISSMPLLGAKGVAVYPNGNKAQGLIVGLDDARYRPTGLKPGEFMLYAVSGGSNRDGSGGTTRPILKGTLDGHAQLTGIEISLGDKDTTTIVIGSDGNTSTVDIFGKTAVTIHAPEIVATNGGSPSRVMTEAGPSKVLKADA